MLTHLHYLDPRTVRKNNNHFDGRSISINNVLRELIACDLRFPEGESEIIIYNVI